jgi:hypothetical protein
MRKTFYFIILFTSLSFAQLLTPKLILQQDEYDFGDIKQGEKVSYTFVLTNGGGDLLKIEEVHPSCGCTAALPEKTELAPGESTNLSVTFNSAGRFGKQKKIVRINSNDPDRLEAMLTIKANVILPDSDKTSYPKLNFFEMKHNFGSVKEGKVVEYVFGFENSGNAQLKIKDIKTSCGCTAALVSSKLVEPGSKGTLRVELDTSNIKGKMTRTVSVNSNDPKDPVKILTVYAQVQ